MVAGTMMNHEPGDDGVDNKNNEKGGNGGRLNHGKRVLDLSSFQRIPGGMRKRTVRRLTGGGTVTRVGRGGVTGEVKRPRMLGGTRMRIKRRVDSGEEFIFMSESSEGVDRPEEEGVEEVEAGDNGGLMGDSSGL